MEELPKDYTVLIDMGDCKEIGATHIIKKTKEEIEQELKEDPEKYNKKRIWNFSESWIKERILEYFNGEPK